MGPWAAVSVFTESIWMLDDVKGVLSQEPNVKWFQGSMMP